MSAHPASLTPLAPGSVAEDERLPARDWVLLNVVDAAFQDMDAVRGWATIDNGALVDIAGYPGGAMHWQALPLVECVVSRGFSQERSPLHPGTLRLNGAASTALG